jgi:hypothetical protein
MRGSVYCVSHRHLTPKKGPTVGSPKPESDPQEPGETPVDRPPPPQTITECQQQQAEVIADLRAGKVTAAAANVLLAGLRGLMKTLPDDGGEREDDLTDEQLAVALRQQLAVVEARIARKQAPGGNGHGLQGQEQGQEAVERRKQAEAAEAEEQAVAVRSAGVVA